MVKKEKSSKFFLKKIQSCMKQLVQNNSCITWMILLLSQIEIDILSFLKCILAMIKSFPVRHIVAIKGISVGHRSDPRDIKATLPTVSDQNGLSHGVLYNWRGIN